MGMKGGCRAGTFNHGTSNRPGGAPVLLLGGHLVDSHSHASITKGFTRIMSDVSRVYLCGLSVLLQVGLRPVDLRNSSPCWLTPLPAA